MTMRRRVLSIRLSDTEYQTLRALADQAGTSVPVHARRLALDSIQLAPRLDSLERLLKDIPDRARMVAAFRTLAEKIDRASGKGGAA